MERTSRYRRTQAPPTIAWLRRSSMERGQLCPRELAPYFRAQEYRWVDTRTKLSALRLSQFDLDKLALDPALFGAANKITLLRRFIVVAAGNGAALVRREHSVANYAL